MKPLKRMLVLLFAVVSTVRAQTVPDFINYQGKLMDGANLFNGTVPIVFRLYDSEEGGDFPHCVDSNDVPVVDGLYATCIGDDVTWGSLDNALNQDQVWIELEIDGQIVAPRERLAGVGYARYAAKLPANAVDMAMIAPDAVRYWHIADDQVRGEHIRAGDVANVHLAAAAVTSNKIDWSTMPATQVPLGGYAENGPFATAPTATGFDAIAMGNGGSAGAAYSVVGGGSSNTAGGVNATVGGGYRNTAGELYATVGGGAYNTASYTATVGGGYANTAGDMYATVGGGQNNISAGYCSTVGGGDGNTVSNNSAASVIAGGRDNMVASNSGSSVISGGSFNKIGWKSPDSVIGGGEDNEIAFLSPNSTIGGGHIHYIHTNCGASVIGGGGQNQIYVSGVVIAGGGMRIDARTNSTSWYSKPNRSESDLSVIGGGWGNRITTNAYAGTIPGGQDARADNYGQMAYASGCFLYAGDAQASEYVLRNSTSSTKIWEALYLNGADRHMQVANNESVVFLAQVVGRSDTGETGAYRIEGLLEGQAGGGVVARGVAVTEIWEDETAWEVRVSTGLGASQDVSFQVMGNGETIRWVATVRTTEVSW